MSPASWGWLVLAFPLAGAIVCSLLYRSRRQLLIGAVGSAAIGLSFASGLAMLA